MSQNKAVGTASDTKSGSHNLKQIQSFIISVLRKPLAKGYRLDKNNNDTDEFASYIKPNSKLNEVERIEIYAQQYWYRLLDNLEEDFPGILSVLGKAKFQSLMQKYLETYPSDSYFLRDLGKNLSYFIETNKGLVDSKYNLVLDLSKFEFAQVFAFDEESTKTITTSDIQDSDLNSLSIRLQPYITLIESEWALDEFTIALKTGKKDATISEASSVKPSDKREETESTSEPEEEKIWLVVHRFENRVFLKRLDKIAFLLLKHIEETGTIGESVSALLKENPELAENLPELAKNVQKWFTSWVKLGWFCTHE